MRIPFLLPGIAALLAALAGGLLRMGWALPAVPPPWIFAHGVLMVCGFLGTVISLERAVGVGIRAGFVVPALIGLGTIAALFMPAEKWGPWATTVGSAGLVVLLFIGASRRWDRAGVWLIIAATTWVVANVLWLSGRWIPGLVPWWAAFLVLTIAAERLELTRFRPTSTAAHRLFDVLAVLLLLATAATVFAPQAAFRVLGALWLALTAWLFKHDISRAAIRRQGLPRFVAICLLGGYAWLGLAGVGALVFGNPLVGLRYDAILHALFVGFVFAMIFGHAPIIFPAVLGLPIRFRRAAYGPLVLLHVTLLLRVFGDLAGDALLRRWGGMGNAVAIVAYFAVTAGSLWGAGGGEQGGEPSLSPSPPRSDKSSGSPDR